MTPSRSGARQTSTTFISLDCVGKAWSRTEHADTLRRLKAADKNTNEGSQVENVSTVVLIDLTDTSSASRWRKTGGIVCCWAAVCVALFLTICLCDSVKSSVVSLFIPSLFYTFILNIASPSVSFACPFICHSTFPLSFLKILWATYTHTHTHVLSYSTSFHFRGYHSGPIPVVLSPKSLLHQRNTVHLSAGADITVCCLTL